MNYILLQKGELIMSLTLDANDMAKLKGMLNASEATFGAVHNFKPEHVVFACTCQGNCDGRTSGCSWG